MSKKKKLFISITICVVCFAVALIFIRINLPDYMTDEFIPKGYTKTDGHSWAGRDLDEYFYYIYDNQPQLHHDYTLVTEDNIEEIKNDVAHYEKGTEGVAFYKSISEGDFFIKHYYNKDGSLTDNFRENEKMYYYDIETKTLHYFYYVW